MLTGISIQQMETEAQQRSQEEHRSFCRQRRRAADKLRDTGATERRIRGLVEGGQRDGQNLKKSLKRLLHPDRLEEEQQWREKGEAGV